MSEFTPKFHSWDECDKIARSVSRFVLPSFRVEGLEREDLVQEALVRVYLKAKGEGQDCTEGVVLHGGLIGKICRFAQLDHLRRLGVYSRKLDRTDPKGKKVVRTYRPFSVSFERELRVDSSGSQVRDEHDSPRRYSVNEETISSDMGEFDELTLTRDTAAVLSQSDLNDRERVILDLIALGYLYKDIGQFLNISETRVSQHLSSARKKLQSVLREVAA